MLKSLQTRHRHVSRSDKPCSRTLLTIATVAALAASCHAVGSSASTASAQDLIDRAAAGQTVTLPAGITGDVKIYDRKFAQPLTIDMTNSNLTSVIIRRSSNIRIVNGRVTGTDERGSFGILMTDSDRIEVSNVTVSKAQAGIGMQRSQDIVIVGNTLTDVISDGIMIQGSQRVKVNYNSCSNFRPIPKVFDDEGNQIKDGDHPDCIQGWSLKGYPRTSDLEVVGNRGYGNFQGVFLNNIIDETEGGFDRVVVTDNDMQIGWYHGVYLQDAHTALVTRNKIRPTGQRDIRGKTFNRLVRPYITISGGDNITACGNIVTEFPTGTAGTDRCKSVRK